VKGSRTAFLKTCLILFAVFLSGCTPEVKSTPINDQYYPPNLNSESIALYYTKLPRCPYEEIGIVSSRQRNKLIKMEQVAESLMQRAREMGGDAVIQISLTERAMGVNKYGHIDNDPVLQGIVIRWTQEGCRE